MAIFPTGLQGKGMIVKKNVIGCFYGKNNTHVTINRSFFAWSKTKTLNELYCMLTVI